MLKPRRMVSRRRFILTASGAAVLPAISQAQNFPSQPIRLIVPFSQGGSTDIIARIIAEPLSKQLKQAVSIDNIGGAGGTLGASAIANAPNDGHTIGMATVSTTGTGPIVRKKIGYDPLIDFTPVIKLVDVPGVISVHPDFPAEDFNSFITQVQAYPGRYSYASSGRGGVQHMGMELFKLRNQLFTVHLPFKGAGPALREVLTGRIDMIWDNLSSSLPHIKAGRLRPIGLVSQERSEQLPDLPTFAQLGMDNYRAETYFGVVAPSGTAPAITKRLNQALNTVINQPAVKQALISAGGIPAGGAPSVLTRQIVTELKKWGEVARYAKISV